MHYEQYYQLATEQKFLDMGVELSDLATCRVLQQEPTVYPKHERFKQMISQHQQVC